jgi:hypothetical protein
MQTSQKPRKTGVFLDFFAPENEGGFGLRRGHSRAVARDLFAP